MTGNSNIATGAWPSTLRTMALVGFAFYCMWNLAWLSHGQLAPSILHELTGIPAPTTGMTRSFWSLMQADIIGSLRLNPMTVPMIMLLALTAGHLACRAIQGRSIALGRGLALAWILALSGAWMIKMAMVAVSIS
ncbi:MAG: hypothetical protein CMJ32_05545 [Phycisphaerae bacterium]|nr:hypothetical protein [Phycisphaerae bacterium]